MVGGKVRVRAVARDFTTFFSFFFPLVCIVVTSTCSNFLTIVLKSCEILCSTYSDFLRIALREMSRIANKSLVVPLIFWSFFVL